MIIILEKIDMYGLVRCILLRFIRCKNLSDTNRQDGARAHGGLVDGDARGGGDHYGHPSGGRSADRVRKHRGEADRLPGYRRMG